MDAREIEKCIDEFGTDIYRFCLKLCMDKSEAEDLYQQTFLKALEMEWTLDWGKNPKALFFSLTHNLWKSDRRKQARRNMIAPCSNLDDEAEAVLHSDESIEESYLQKELISEVNRIIETLPEKIRIPLTLFYLSNCSVEQISTIIKKPPGTVKSRLFKGRSLIKKRLEEAGYENDLFNTEIDEIIRASMKLADEPDPELNNKLKATLYQKETAMRKQPATRGFSLWYLPMILNLVTFIMLAGVALIVISNTYLSYFAAGICFYIGLAGVLLTIVGVKRTNMKEDITIRVEKRGALA